MSLSPTLFLARFPPRDYNVATGRCRNENPYRQDRQFTGDPHPQGPARTDKPARRGRDQRATWIAGQLGGGAGQKWLGGAFRQMAGFGDDRLLDGDVPSAESFD